MRSFPQWPKPPANMEFHAYGMKDLFETTDITYGANSESCENKGRYCFTDADLYKFKVPQLYNLKDSPFYGHGSSFRNIREVVAYKNKGIKENANVPDDRLSEYFKPLGLTEVEIDDISAFIEKSLRDPICCVTSRFQFVRGTAFLTTTCSQKLTLVVIDSLIC